MDWLRTIGASGWRGKRYATFYNEVTRNDLYGKEDYNDESKWKVFSDELVQKFKDQSEPIRFPSTRWTDYLMKKSTTQTKANVNISGGTDKVKYFISAGMYYQGGLFKQFDQDYEAGYNYHRFNYRSNLDLKVTKTTNISLNISGSVDDVARPLIGSTSALMKQIYYASPFVSPGVVDGKFITTATNYTDIALPFTGSNPMGSWYGQGYYKNGANRISFDGKVSQKLDFITKNDFTGKVSLEGGRVFAKTVSMAGFEGSLGAFKSVAPEDFQLKDVELYFNSPQNSTDHGMMVTGEVTLTVPDGGAAAITGLVTGEGQLIKDGAGQLNLNAVNTYTGGTILRKGTLAMGNNFSQFGDKTKAITVENGTIRFYDSNHASNAVTFYNPIVIANPTDTLTLKTGTYAKVLGAISGQGVLNVNANGTRDDYRCD